MKIVLATSGSRGDVQPMLALSLALKAAGHDVLLAGPPEKAAWAEQLECPFHALEGDVTAFLDGMKDAHTFRSALRFVAFLRKELISQFEIFPDIISGADLVVGSSLVFTLSSVAESMGIEYRYLLFTPQLIPSASHPFVAFKHQGLPGWFNLMTWRVALTIDRFDLGALVNRKRLQLGLKPIRDFWAHILGKRVIVASDKVIAGVPPDVKTEFTQTGYMHLDQPDQDLPELESFLIAGPPPVYAGFGSMPKRDQAGNVPLIVRAARSVGRRAVITRFWDEPLESAGSDDVFFIKNYPHLRLFPRMAAVIHHGGAGTTATAAVSGVPQIIVPHALDQYYWAHQVHRSNLGPKPIWRSKLTSEKLAGAIRECLTNRELRQKARAAAEGIDRRESLERTVRDLVDDRP
jgi:vancomycin aglycone glucosyltransferase